MPARDGRIFGGAWRRRLGRLAALPAPVQDARRLTYVGVRVTSDRRSLRTFARLARAPADEPSTAVPALARLRLRPLGGQEVLVRPGTSDIGTVKIDVEGAERELLRDGSGWAEEVRCLKVELHGDYGVEDCQADLRRLGFEARQDPDHWACAVGLRR